MEGPEQPNLNEWVRRYAPLRLRRHRALRQLQQQMPARPVRRGTELDGDPEAELLVELWSMGIIPANWVQHIAAASAAAAPRPQINLLANMGSAGQYTNNIARDFRRLLRLNENGIAEPLVLRIDMWDLSSTDVAPRVVDFPILLPHELIASIYERYPEEFELRISGRPGKVEAFWNEMRDNDPRIFQHPIVHQADYDRFCIPLRLHGDGVPFGKALGHTLDCTSISSMVAEPGDSWILRLLMAALANVCETAAQMHGQSIKTFIWIWLIWSLECLVRGEWPTHDPFGVPLQDWRSRKQGRLCGRWQFVVLQVAADLDWLCNYLHLPHFNSHEPCMFCRANRTNRPWTDMRQSAAFIETVKQGAELRVDCHPLFRSEVLALTLAHVCPDILHCVDLGAAQHVAGSIICMLVWDAGFEGDLNTRIRYVWQEIVRSYATLQCPTSERVPWKKMMGLFENARSANPTDFPRINIKGAQARHVVPCLLDVANRLVRGHPEFQHALIALESLVTFYDAVMPHGQFLPPDVAARAQAGMQLFLLHYAYLAHLNLQRRRRLFFITEKSLHYSWHIAHVCMYYNPKAGWTYMDEDFVGKIGQLCSSSIRGLGPNRVGPSLIQKYRVRLHIRYSRG